MPTINKTAVLNPLLAIEDSIDDYVPRATTSKFGVVAIGSGINVDHLGRIYLDTQEYSDRLAAIEAEAASSLATQKSEVAAAIAQVNLTQSQTITALTLEVNNLKTDLTNSITATETDLINRADQLAQEVTDITDQLAQDKAAFTQEIQDALVSLENEASVASALRTPRKIQGVDFDGTQDISLPVFSEQADGLVPKRVGATDTKYLREDGTWVSPPNTSYALLTQANAEAGTDTTANTISAQVLKNAIQYHTPTVTTITGNAGTATKLQTPRTISLIGGATGSVSFDGDANVSIATTITGLGAANGIATLDSSGQVPSTQLPSYVDDVLEYVNVAAFPTTGVTGKIYVETTGNTTYRWSGSGYIKITSGEVSSVAGKTGVVTLTKTDVGLANVDNTADSVKNVASAAKLTTARTIGGVSFDGTANINLPGVNATGNQNTSGNAASATKLATARTINGVAFDGSANIAIGEPSFASPLSGHSSFDANALNTGGFNVRYLSQTAANKPTGTDHAIMTLNYSTIWSGQQAFDWRTGNVFTRTQNNGTWLNWATQVDTRNYATTLPIFSVNGVGLVPARVGSTTTKFLREDGTWVAPADTTYVAMTEADANAGTETTARLITAAVLKSAIQTHAPTPTSVTGNAATATKLQTARSINGVLFDGTQDISLPIPEAYSLPTASASVLGGIKVGSGLTISDSVLSVGTLNQDTTGNAATATKLATAPSINGTSFDGTAAITTVNWGTARTLTIGSTGKSVDGSANVSWSLAEIGAAASDHTHAYLSTSGGTLSGGLSVTGTITATGNITAFSDARLKDNITKIPDALNKLNQLKGVTYTRKDLATNTQYAGLIAQDVQKVLPEAVAATEDDIIAVDYNGVIGLLVEAIKELNNRIDKLERI